ncbi:hypothetical protein HMPREF0083_00064, partial [Aneurinibacillus aneurinilyticus ATCC 12856]
DKRMLASGFFYVRKGYTKLIAKHYIFRLPQTCMNTGFDQ